MQQLELAEIISLWCLFVYGLVFLHTYIHIQGYSGGICNNLGNYNMCDSKQNVHMNLGPILNGYRDMVKRRYGPSCEHERQL